MAFLPPRQRAPSSPLPASNPQVAQLRQGLPSTSSPLADLLSAASAQRSTTASPNRAPSSAAASSSWRAEREVSPDRAPPVCVAVCQGDLFLADGRRLRLVSLRALEDVCRRRFNTGNEDGETTLSAVWRIRRLLKEVDFWYLDTSLITFEIRRLVPSPNGRLLLLVGDSEMAVIALPFNRARRHTGATLPSSCFLVAEKHHSASAPRILKVDWHPLSEEGIHLAVLTKDGLFRIYDLIQSLEDPRQLIDIRSRIGGEQLYKTSGFSTSTFAADPDAARVVSFSFGRSENGWSSLAVYVLMKNGDLYSLCPILPKRCRLRRSYVEALLIQTEREKNEAGFSVNNKRTAALDRQSSWLQELLRLEGGSSVAGSSSSSAFTGTSIAATSSSKAENLSDYVSVNRARAVALQPEPYARGPYLMQPAPVEVDGNMTDASDLLCLPNYPSDLVIVAYDSGKLDVCMTAEPPEPGSGERFWEEDEVSLPCLVVHECLQLFQSTHEDYDPDLPGWPRLLADPMYTDRFYCYHLDGVYSIDTRPWMSVVQEWWAADGDFQLSEMELPGSEVGCLLRSLEDTGDEQTPTEAALCVIEDSVASYSMLFLSPQEQLVLQELSPHMDNNKPVAGITSEGQELALSRNPSSGASALAGTLQSEPDPPRSPYTTLLESFSDSKANVSAQQLLANLSSLQSTPAPRLFLTRSQTTGKGKDEQEDPELNIQQLKKVIEAYLSRMQAIRLAAHEMEKRAEQQKKEALRQRELIVALANKLDHEMYQRTEKIQTRLAATAKRHQDLTRHADLLAHRTATYRDPTLNRREQDFSDQLQEIEEYARRLRIRATTMKSDVDSVRKQEPSAHRSASLSNSRRGRGLDQMSELEKALETENEMLMSVQTRISKLQELMSRLGLEDQPKEEV